MALLMVSKGSVDPLERGGQSDLAARSSDDRLMDAPGVANTGETAQAVTDDSASGIEIALRQGGVSESEGWHGWTVSGAEPLIRALRLAGPMRGADPAKF
jgi:hypothetical protein